MKCVCGAGSSFQSLAIAASKRLDEEGLSAPAAVSRIESDSAKTARKARRSGREKQQARRFTAILIAGALKLPLCQFAQVLQVHGQTVETGSLNVKAKTI